MAITTTNLGTATNSASVASFALTTTANVPAGALIVILVEDKANSTAASSVTDSVGNTYVLAASQSRGSTAASGRGMIYYAANATALPSGSSITYTKALSASFVGFTAFCATGVAAASPLDAAVTAGTFATSTAPSVTSGAASVAGELFVALVTPSGAETYTEDTGDGWTAVNDLTGAGSTTNPAAYGAIQINAGTGALTYAPTLSVSSAWSAQIVAFQASTGTTQHLAADAAATATSTAALRVSHHMAAAAQAFATGTAALDLQHHLAAAAAALATSAAGLRSHTHLAAAVGAVATASAILRLHESLGASLADIATGTGALDVQKHLAAAAKAVATMTAALDGGSGGTVQHLAADAHAQATATVNLETQRHLAAAAADIASATAALQEIKELVAAASAVATGGPVTLRQAVHLGVRAVDTATMDARLERAQPVPQNTERRVENVEVAWQALVNRADPSHAEANRRELEYAFGKPGRKFTGDPASRGAYDPTADNRLDAFVLDQSRLG